MHPIGTIQDQAVLLQLQRHVHLIQWLTSTEEKKLAAFDLRSTRQIFGYKWSDFVVNQKVRCHLKQQPKTCTTLQAAPELADACITASPSLTRFAYQV